MERTRLVVMTALEDLKAKGDECMKKGDTLGAIMYYTQAIDIIKSTRTEENRQLVAKIWSNRSAAYLKIKQYQQALRDGEYAVVSWPQWHKGYIRMSMAMEALEDYANSLMMHQKALELVESGDIEKAIFEDTLLSLCLLIIRVIDINNPLATKHFYEAAERFDVAESLMEYMVTSDRYDILLSFLKLELDVSMKKRVKEMILHELVNYTFYNSQEVACIAGLQNGALTLDDFCYHGYGTPLHHGVMRAMMTGSTKLLEYLLKNHLTKKEQVERLDLAGCTIMHCVVFKCVLHQRKDEAFKILECLSSFDHVDLMMRDRNGNSAVAHPAAQKVPFLVEAIKSKHRKRVNKLNDESSRRQKTGDKKTSKEKYKDEEKEKQQMIEETLRSNNEKLLREVTELRKKIMCIKEQQNKRLCGEVAQNETVKFTIPDTGVKLEVALCKLPEVLEKLAVITLHQ